MRSAKDIYAKYGVKSGGARPTAEAIYAKYDLKGGGAHSAPRSAAAPTRYKTTGSRYSGKYDGVDMDALRSAQKEALNEAVEFARSIPSRIKDTVVGGVVGVGSDYANNVGSAAYGEAKRQQRQMREDLNGWKQTIEVYQSALDNPQSTQTERETANYLIEDMQRRINAYEKAYGASGSNELAAKSIWDVADSLEKKSENSINRAKQELGPVGRSAVDLGVMGTQVLNDEMLLPFAIISKFFRTLGQSSREARQNGADFDTAMKYGGANAASAVFLEMFSDGLKGKYGKGLVDEKVKDFSRKIGNDDNSKILIKAMLSDLGEAAEGGTNAMTNQILKSLYEGKSGKGINWDDVMRETIINAIFGILSGDSGMREK